MDEIARGPALWLWDALRRTGAAGFFVPLSGGADSAAVATIVGSMCQQIMTFVLSGSFVRVTWPLSHAIDHSAFSLSLKAALPATKSRIVSLWLSFLPFVFSRLLSTIKKPYTDSE